MSQPPPMILIMPLSIRFLRRVTCLASLTFQFLAGSRAAAGTPGMGSAARTSPGGLPTCGFGIVH
jgi:hypothetical protein